MADYTSNLKTWGATGSEYPDGYSYLEGEQPVDDWDNFIRYNAVEDTQHLVELTNKRVESDSGTSHPGSPEAAHLSYRNDEERLFHYDSTASSWHGLLKVDGDTLQGTLDAGGHTITGVGSLELAGAADLAGNDLDDTENGNTVYDSVAGNVPLAVLEQSEVTVSAGSHLSGGGTISLGDSVTVSVDDDFLLNTGDTMSGELTASRAEGSRMFTAENSTSGDRLAVQSETDGDFLLVGYDSSTGSWETDSALEYSPGNGVWTFKSNPAVNGDSIATQVWVNNNADVPNADYADSAGDANTLDGNDSTDFAASGHGHDSRYILENGDTMSGVLTLSDGSTAASQSWVNNNADVPNADHADTAGNAETLDGADSTDYWMKNEQLSPNSLVVPVNPSWA